MRKRWREMEESFLQQGRLEKKPINRQTSTQTHSIWHLREPQRFCGSPAPRESFHFSLAEPHQLSQQKHTFGDAWCWRIRSSTGQNLDVRTRTRDTFSTVENIQFYSSWVGNRRWLWVLSVSLPETIIPEEGQWLCYCRYQSWCLKIRLIFYLHLLRSPQWVWWFIFSMFTLQLSATFCYSFSAILLKLLSVGLRFWEYYEPRCWAGSPIKNWHQGQCIIFSVNHTFSMCAKMRPLKCSYIGLCNHLFYFNFHYKSPSRGDMNPGTLHHKTACPHSSHRLKERSCQISPFCCSFVGPEYSIYHLMDLKTLKTLGGN